VEVGKLNHGHLSNLVGGYNIVAQQDGALQIRPCLNLKFAEHLPKILSAFNVLHYNGASSCGRVRNLHVRLSELSVADVAVEAVCHSVEVSLTVHFQ